MEAGKVKFILLKTLGEAYVTKDVTDAEILFFNGMSYGVSKI